ncbi:hypothetical protein SH139x_004218 [Planctomycetaceae bacterium SH139]
MRSWEHAERTGKTPTRLLRRGRQLMMLAAWLCASSIICCGFDSAGSAQAEEQLAAWDFSRRDDLNFDNQPDGWVRIEGRRYPHYAKLKIQPHRPAQELQLRTADEQAFRLWQKAVAHVPNLPMPPSLTDMLTRRFLSAHVDGGGILCQSPPFPVAKRYSYHLRANIKSEGFEHDQAWLELAFYEADLVDPKGNRSPGKLLQTIATEQIGGSSDWRAVQLGPITAPINAEVGRVRIRVEPQERQDFQGYAGFDAIRVSQTPRIRMECDQPGGLYSPPGAPQITCTVSGLADSVPSVFFRLLDENGNELATHQAALNPSPLDRPTAGSAVGNSVGNSAGTSVTTNIPSPASNPESSLSSNTGVDEGQPNAVAEPSTIASSGGIAVWQLPELGPGFYRVRAALDNRGPNAFEIEQTFAVLADLPTPQGPFGWSLTGPGRHNFPLIGLPPWLSQCRVQWVKYPCWLEPTAYKKADELARLMGRLEDRGINTVGVICQPPAVILPLLNMQAEDHVAIMLRETEAWQPLLEPVMARLSNGVDWWQLGDEGDYSFLGRAQLKSAIDEIRVALQGYGQPIKIVLNWPWLDPLPPDSSWSWHAVCLSDPTPPTAAEIKAYFRPAEPLPGADQLSAADPLAAAENNSAAKSDPELANAPGMEAQNLDGSLRQATQLVANNSFIVAGGGGNSAGQSPSEPKSSGKHWLILEPLPRDAYPRGQRIRDLVERMLVVREMEIKAAFISDPFDPRLGLLREDGSPDEMLLPWRTAAALLGDLKPVGSLDLPGSSQNVLLANAETATLVVWNEQPTEEAIYLGDEARHIDAFGRELPIKPVQLRNYPLQQITVTSEPTFVTNLDRTAALWRLAVRLDRQRVDSLLGREQTIELLFTNPSDQTITGQLQVEAPEAWNVSRWARNIVAEAGREQSEKLSLTLRNDATIGEEKIAFDFELEGDSRRRFTVWRKLNIGPEDVHIEVTTRLLPSGVLVVRQEITNTSNRPLQFDCSVYAPQRQRQRQTVAIPAETTVTCEFAWPAGEDLIDQVLQLRASQHNGARTLNFRFKATR